MYEHASVPRSGTVAQGMLTAHGKGPKSVLVCFHVFFFGTFCVFVNWDLLPEGKGRCVGPNGAQIRVWGGGVDCL